MHETIYTIFVLDYSALISSSINSQVSSEKSATISYDLDIGVNSSEGYFQRLVFMNKAVQITDWFLFTCF